MYMLLYFIENDYGLGKESVYFLDARLFNVSFQIKSSSATVVESKCCFSKLDYCAPQS